MPLDLLEPAPFGDEQRHRLGAAAHRFELDALVEAVDRLGVRSIDEGGDAGIKAEETGIGRAGGRDLLQRLAEDATVRATEQRHRLLAVPKHVTLRLEAVIDDLRRVVGEEAVGARRVADHRFDLSLRRRDVLAGIDGDADIEDAPGGHARRPVAAGDLADIEIDRMLDGRVWRIVAAPRVPVLLEPVQRLHDAVGGLDRVGARARLANMNGNAADMNLEPQDADLRADQLVPHRLRNQRGVGAVAAFQARERAVAGAFLLDDRLDVDVGGWAIAE